jgi:hypothetical protein
LALEDNEGDSGVDEPTTYEPQISIHMITGIRANVMMQVCIQLGGISLLTLLDSGSTHNFVVEEAASHTSLQLRIRANCRLRWQMATTYRA